MRRVLTLADIEPNKQWIEQVDGKRKATERNDELSREQLFDPGLFNVHQLMQCYAAEQGVAHVQRKEQRAILKVAVGAVLALQTIWQRDENGHVDGCQA